MVKNFSLWQAVKTKIPIYKRLKLANQQSSNKIQLLKSFRFYQKLFKKLFWQVLVKNVQNKWL
jgi:hypothetical protein